MSIPYREFFDALYNNVTNVKNQYSVWRALQKKDYEATFNENKYFWAITLHSLQRGWLLGLAKLFEEKNPVFGDAISFYYAADYLNAKQAKRLQLKIAKHAKLLRALKKLRHKIVAHDDAATRISLDDFYKKHHFTYRQVEELLTLAGKLLGDVESAVTGKGHVFAYKVFEEWCIKDVELLMRDLRR